MTYRIMKKTTYIAPAVQVMQIHTEQLLNTISAPTSTNVAGLGVSDENYEGEVRSRSYSVWGDDEEEDF